MWSKGPDDVGWLVDWAETQHLRHSAPLALPASVAILHPFTTPDGQPRTWREVAIAHGVDPATLVVNPQLRPGAVLDIQGGPMDLNSPDEGILPLTIRRAVVDCLAGSSNQPVNVGFYGGWGQPEGIAPISGPVTVAGLEYWFSTAAGAPFFRAWSRLDDAAGAAPWEYVVSFVWPDDRSWFLCIDPDSSYTELSGSRALVEQLCSAGLETVQLGARDGTWASGHPTY